MENLLLVWGRQDELIPGTTGERYHYSELGAATRNVAGGAHVPQFGMCVVSERPAGTGRG